MEQRERSRRKRERY